MELIAEGVYKTLQKKVILNNINLKLYSGNIYAFIGRNGSGKTMLFRALSGLIKCDSGKIVLDGKVLHKDFSVMPNQGIVLENAGLYPNLTGKQNLLYLANINHKVGEEDVVKTLQRVGLNPQDKRIYQKYSLGMKQRLIIAQAIMEKPDIIFLDEPTNSLDENGVNEIRTIIKQERDRGALILLSSHNNDDIKELADKVYKMESGEIKEWNNEKS